MSNKKYLIMYYKDKLPFPCAVLKSNLIDHDMSGKQLGDKMGLSKQRINDWIIGHRVPNMENRTKIANVLGIAVEEFDIEYWNLENIILD